MHVLGMYEVDEGASDAKESLTGQGGHRGQGAHLAHQAERDWCNDICCFRVSKIKIEMDYYA